VSSSLEPSGEGDREPRISHT